MSRIYTFVTWLILILLLSDVSVLLSKPKANGAGGKRADKQLITLDYVNKDLVDVINFLAGLKGVNIVLPQEGNKIDAKITWRLDHKVSLKEAWNILYTLLQVAGYEMHPQGDFYRIVKTAKDTTAHLPAKTFIGVSPDQLPNSDEQIKYVYFFSNVKLTDSSDDEIPKVLTSILPSSATFKIDADSNAVIIMGGSYDIKSAMQIIQQLDQVTNKESMEIIRLQYADPLVIANLFNENILKTTVNRYRLDAQKQSEASYFSQYLKMFAIPRLNAVIVFGRPASIDRVRTFIQEYLDIEQGNGKSILHVYQLQYLDVQQFAQVLEKVVESTKPTASATGQAQGEAGGAPVAGTERFFENVIISVDRPREIVETTQEGRKASTPYYGGNKLLIAARNEDWLRLKKLIEELDTPLDQVYIEVLIADLTISDQRALSSIIRAPRKIPMPSDMTFQSAQTLESQNGIITNQWAPTNPPNPQPMTVGVIERSTTSSDLLRGNAYEFNTGQKNLTDAGNASSLIFPPPGTTVVSLNDNDGSTWGILQALKVFDRNKILSHPHVMATANQPATIEISEKRLVAGGATGSNNLQRVNEPIEAKLQVQIIPRISPADTVNLQIAIDISEFVQGVAVGNARIVRKIETNVNIKNGDILTLGGLIRDDTTRTRTGVPILQDIPFLGWLFKGRANDEARTNLTVFISPSIIKPRLRQGAGRITRHYMEVAKVYANEGELFESLRDPITRWYFQTDPAPKRMVGNFLMKDEVLASYAANPEEQLLEVPEKKSTRTIGNRVPSTMDGTQDCDLKGLVQDMENPFSSVEKNPDA